MGLFPSYFGGPGSDPSPAPGGSSSGTAILGSIPALSQTDPDFGTDISMLPDLDDTFQPYSGRGILAQALLRRITTRPGTLDFWPEYSYDVRDLLRDNVDQASLYRGKASVQNALEADQRVASASVGLQWLPATQELQFTIGVETAAGPFSLVVSVTDAAVKLLTYKEG